MVRLPVDALPEVGVVGVAEVVSGEVELDAEGGVEDAVGHAANFIGRF
ncbi:hypothetical protein [Micromonospora tulbaghiae]